MKDKPLAKLLMDEAGVTQRISKQINIGMTAKNCLRLKNLQNKNSIN